MQWSDKGLVLGARAHGESSVILELMTRDHGRYLGLVHGGRSSRLRPVLQPGNAVAATWRARLDEQMGTYTVEPAGSRAARLIASPAALSGWGTLAAHLRLLAERDPHPALFDAAEAVAEHLDQEGRAPALLSCFELLLLAELGFGLDLTSCAATGARADLAYVSPRSGRAVGRSAGEPWREKLLPLPAYLIAGGVPAAPPSEDIIAAFRLTGFFLERHVYEPRGMQAPDERGRFLARVGHSKSGAAL